MMNGPKVITKFLNCDCCKCFVAVNVLLFSSYLFLILIEVLHVQ